MATVLSVTPSFLAIAALLIPSSFNLAALGAICWYTGAAPVSRIAASIGISAKVLILCERVHHFFPGCLRE